MVVIFMKIDPVGDEFSHTDGRTETRTDVTKLIVAFRNLANAPKNLSSASESPPPPRSHRHKSQLVNAVGDVKSKLDLRIIRKIKMMDEMQRVFCLDVSDILECNNRFL
jgi:hypothetical protein